MEKQNTEVRGREKGRPAAGGLRDFKAGETPGQSL